MNERPWELFRLSVVETWAESPYKKAVYAAIQHKLMILERDTAAGMKPHTTPHSPRYSPGAGGPECSAGPSARSVNGKKGAGFPSDEEGILTPSRYLAKLLRVR